MHPHYSDEQRDELRTNARELSGFGLTAAQIAKALRISQAEVLAYLRQNKPLPAQLSLFGDGDDPHEKSPTSGI